MGVELARPHTHPPAAARPQACLAGRLAGRKFGFFFFFQNVAKRAPRGPGGPGGPWGSPEGALAGPWGPWGPRGPWAPYPPYFSFYGCCELSPITLILGIIPSGSTSGAGYSEKESPDLEEKRGY